MIRRVEAHAVRLGMYVHGLEGSWLNHPFWKTKFLLTDPADLAALQDSGIEAVLVDDEKGAPEEAWRAEILPAAAPVPDVAPTPNPAATPIRPRRVAELPDRCTAGEEMQRAAKILNRSKRAVNRLFAEVRMGKAVNGGEVLPLVEDVSSSVSRNPSALISIARIRSKDEYTYVHSVAVCALMINLGRQLGLDEGVVRDLGVAGLLHDVGKVATPPEVLNKPGKLTDEEFVIMRSHPERGHEVLTRSEGVPEVALDVCLHHHERIDGSGYPHGLKGEEISLASRIASVCDVYDAISSNRPYKEAWGAADSLANMYRWDGHFDKRLLNAFIRSVGIYPVGSLVKMRSGRIGLVIDQNPDDLTAPLVRIFSKPDRGALSFHDLDLGRPDCDDAITGREDPERWGLTPWEMFWTDLIARKPAAPRRAIAS